jgi:uncharacterized protein (TIGR03435 family)
MLLHTAVIDETGLKGEYSFKVAGTLAGSTSDADRPLTSNALKDRLGLLLQPRQLPTDVFVIDGAAKPIPDQRAGCGVM